MITVSPIQDKSEQEALCRACGVKYLPDALAYRGAADGVFCGLCQFSMDGNGGHLFDLYAAPDADADTLFLMGRAALNFIDLCGVREADFRGTADPALLSRIGFREKDGKWQVDLAGFFLHPCRHDSAKNG